MSQPGGPASAGGTHRTDVLLICGSLRLGGTERHMQLLARHLDRSRFRVSMAVLDPSFELAGGIPPDVAVHHLPDRREGARRIRRIIGEGGIDVVYCCDPDSGYFAVIGTAGRRVRRLVGRRGFQPEHTWKQRAAQYALLATAHRLTVNSRPLLATLPRHRRARVEVIPNGIDAAAVSVVGTDESRSRFGRHPLGAPVIGTVARLHPAKGIDVLLAAFARVREVERDVRLTIVGGGPEQAALERQVRELGLGDHVAMTGGRSDALDAFPGFDVFVLSSRTEAFPNVLLEAMAHGVPCVATSVGGVPDLVTAGETGWLAPPDDPPALASTLVAALGSPRRREVGERGRDLVRTSYDLRVMVRRFENLLDATAHG